MKFYAIILSDEKNDLFGLMEEIYISGEEAQAHAEIVTKGKNGMSYKIREVIFNGIVSINNSIKH